MEEFFVKYALHVFGGLISTGLVALVGFGWRIVILGKNNNNLLLRHSELLEDLIEKTGDVSLRVDLHDALFSNVYGTSVSSKMILNGTQELPKFRKTREH